MLEDTIIAISTPPGYGGLGIVRLSGKRSLPAAKKIFVPRVRGSGFSPGRPVFGSLKDSETNETFDEAFLTYFKAPHSYTREDVVEISCHGSPVVLEEIVRLGVRWGARHAHPGEFTLRAYRNGRMDIIQAEAVNDLIQAVSLEQAKISLKQLGGSLSRRIVSIRKQIIRLLSRMEAGIEFPDEGLKIMGRETVRAMEKLILDIDELVASYNAGRAMTEGIELAIAGKTNVGKSTLFNALLERERAIVTPYPGTTRDYLREKVVIRDSIFYVVDMAGLGRPTHPVEKEGWRLGKKLARESDGVILVFDASRKLSQDDIRLLKLFLKQRIIIVINKIDMRWRFDKSVISRIAPDVAAVEISALKGLNLDGLKSLIRKTFVPSPDGKGEIILHSRQKILLEEISSILEHACTMLLSGVSDEICAEELRRILPLIGRLTGEIQVEDVIEGIFHQFCVGK